MRRSFQTFSQHSGLQILLESDEDVDPAKSDEESLPKCLTRPLVAVNADKFSNFENDVDYID